MKNNLTNFQQELLDKIEQGGMESIEKHSFIWCALDGKKHGCKTFNERITQISEENKNINNERR